MRRIFTIILLITLLFNVNSHGNKIDVITTNCKGAVLMEAETGRVLYDKNSHIQLPMASTTKIMTAIMAVESGKLDDIVEISRNAAVTEGSSLYLASGQKIKLEYLVYGLMLRSGNDCGVAIAEHLGKTVEQFAEMMNKKAKEIGATKTNFKNPHGLHHKEHYTTAYDLALITRYALGNEKFKEIFSAKSKKIPWGEDGENITIANKNKTLWEYEGGDGGKTGYTKIAGRCLVTTATKNDIQVIAVVLDCYDWFEQCYRMMDFGFSNYSRNLIFEKNQFVRTIGVQKGITDKLPVIIKEEISLVLGEHELEQVVVYHNLPETLTAPIRKGDTVGSVTVGIPKLNISKTVDIISKDKVDEKRYKNYFYEILYSWIKIGI